MYSPAGKVAVVTGAASGIGRAICIALARAGAAGVAVLDLDLAGAQATAALVTANGARAVALRCDVGRESDLVAVVQRAETELGDAVSCFVANAGITGAQRPGKVTADNATWEASWRVNVMQSVFASRLVIPAMLERGEGCFVVNSSAAGLFTFPNGEPTTYISTKHAVRSLADSLRVRYQGRGVSVCCMCPKFVRSAMTEGLSDRFVASVGGWVTADEVAQELLRCMASGRYLVLSHQETADEVRLAFSDFEGTLDAYAGMNAATHKARQRPKL